MTYLLDISTLIALLIADHQHHKRVFTWMRGKNLAICPLTELGFLRIAVGTYHATPEQAHMALQNFVAVKKPAFVPADISALTGKLFPSYRKSTDWYLANLAEHHGMKWATLDTQSGHAAAHVIT